jgi:ribosomal protein S18 acetylase RimI-like enzyme
VTLRAATAEDEPFLRRVYASSRAEELAVVGWTVEQQAAFLTMQFDAQDIQYRATYEGAEFLVVEHDGAPVGRLYRWRQPGELVVLDITLLPEWRNQGVGTRLLTDLLDEATADGLCVSLHVRAFNPARRLYDRLGFVETEHGQVDDRLEWRPA